MEMGDHFWPSVYPALAVGLMYGVVIGGWLSGIAGAFGALAAAALAFALATPFFSQDGLGPLAALLVVSLAGAAAVVHLLLAMRRGGPTRGG